MWIGWCLGELVGIETIKQEGEGVVILSQRLTMLEGGSRRNVKVFGVWGDVVYVSRVGWEGLFLQFSHAPHTSPLSAPVLHTRQYWTISIIMSCSHVAHIISLVCSCSLSLPNPQRGLCKSYVAERNKSRILCSVPFCRDGEFKNAIVKVAFRGGGKI